MKQTVLKIKLWQHLADVPARCCKYQVWKLHQGNSVRVLQMKKKSALLTKLERGKCKNSKKQIYIFLFFILGQSVEINKQVVVNC